MVWTFLLVNVFAVLLLVTLRYPAALLVHALPLPATVGQVRVALWVFGVEPYRRCSRRTRSGWGSGGGRFRSARSRCHARSAARSPVCRR